MQCRLHRAVLRAIDFSALKASSTVHSSSEKPLPTAPTDSSSRHLIASCRLSRVQSHSHCIAPPPPASRCAHSALHNDHLSRTHRLALHRLSFHIVSSRLIDTHRIGSSDPLSIIARAKRFTIPGHPLVESVAPMIAHASSVSVQ